MDLAEAFRNHRDTIVNKWVAFTLSTYASSSFFLRERDNFANPVGGNIRDALGRLFPLLVRGAAATEMHGPLEQILAIRAVQDFTPSQALAPLNAVKHITREVFTADRERSRFVTELYDFDFAVDLAVLAAFDIYMGCRERLHDVRIAEIKSGRDTITDSGCPSRLLPAQNIAVPQKDSGV